MPRVPSVPKSVQKEEEDHVPRPPNRFILFRSWASQIENLPNNIKDILDEIQSKPRPIKRNGETVMEFPNRNSAMSIYLGRRWREMDEEEKEIWGTKGREVKETHTRMHPNYKYRPTKKGGLKSKRKAENDREGDENDFQPVAGPSTGVPIRGSGRANPYRDHYSWADSNSATLPLQPYSNYAWTEPSHEQQRVVAEPYTLQAYQNTRYPLPQEWMAWATATWPHSGAQTFQRGWNDSTWAGRSYVAELPEQQFEFEECVDAAAGHASTSGGSEDLFEGSEYTLYEEDGYSASTASYPSSSTQGNPQMCMQDPVRCLPHNPAIVDDTGVEEEESASESGSDSMYKDEDYTEDCQPEGITQEVQEAQASDPEPVFRWAFNFDEDSTSWEAEREREDFRRWLGVCNTEWVFPPYEGS